MDALEIVHIQVFLHVTHWTGEVVMCFVLHVKDTVVLHCLYVSDFAHGDTLASIAAAYEEYVLWILE